MAEVDLQSLRSGKDPDEDKNEVSKRPGRVAKRHRGVISDVCETIFDTSVDDVFETVKTERLIPDLKALVCNTLVDGIEMLFGGGGSPRRRSSIDDKRRGYRDYANANKRNSNSNRSGSDRDDRTGNGSDHRRFDSRDYEVETRGQAEKALYELREKCEDDGRATVAEFFELTDYVSDWPDWDIGWDDLDETNSRIRAQGKKWVLLLPQPKKFK